MYFKLCINELSYITNKRDKSFKIKEEWSEYLSDPSNWKKHFERINIYFAHLANSMDVVYKALDSKEFAKFRLSLIPASGFQTVQLRKIEIMMTDLKNLQYKGDGVEKGSLEGYYENIYWKTGSLQTKLNEDGNLELVLVNGKPL